MSEQRDAHPAAAIDSGPGAVVMLLRYYGIGADPGQISSVPALILGSGGSTSP